MNDQQQTTESLIEELARLQSHVAELEAQLAGNQQVAAAWWQTYNSLPLVVASEAKYRRLYESMKDAFVSVTMDGRIQEYNEAYRQMLGYEPEELASLTFRDLTPSKWHAFQNELIQSQVIARGYSDTYEKEYRRKDGTLVPVELRTILLKDDDGQPCGMWAIVHDITARKKAEETLRSTERMVRTLMDASPESILLLDTAGTILLANETTARRLGKSVNEIVGRTAYDLLPAEVAANRRRWVEEVVRTGRSARFEDRRCDRYMENALYPVFDEQGKVTSVAVLGIDLTERKRNEEALRESEQRYRSLAESTTDVIYILDETGKLLYANATAAAYFGVTPESLVNKTQHDLFPPDIAEHHLQRIRRVFDTGEAGEMEALYRFGTQDVWLNVRAIPLRDEQGRVASAMGICRNITAQKRAEEALQRAHEDLERKVKERTDELAIFRRFVEASGRGFGMADLQGHITYVNATLCRLFGETSPEDVIGRHVCAYYPEEYRQRRENEVIPTLFREGSWQGEQEILSRNGTLIPTFQNTFLINDENGKPFRLATAIADISELKKTEAALRESEERFELAVRSVGVGIWDWNIRTGKVYYSPAWKKLFGYEESDIGDRVDDWARLLHPDERAWILKFQDDFLAGMLPTVTVEYRLRHKDGSYRWIQANGLVVRDEQGKACRFVGSHADITDRKRAEEALRQSEAKYRALVESCPDSVVMVDLQGRIRFASQRAAEQHGCLHPEELVGKAATELVAEVDRDRFRANIGHLLQEGVRRNISYRGLRSDGTTFDAEISSAVIRDAAGNPEALMGMYRDVTERKQAEARLRVKDAESIAAAEIQTYLLPHEAPQVPGFDIAGRCYPAETAAGDHFDYLRLSDGSLLLVMGDVSGHGIGPAILAADFCARLRTLSEITLDLAEMARRTNAWLYRETAGEKFVTAILGRLDPKSRCLTYVNAGHPPAIVLNSAGEIKAHLARGGLSLAIVPETSYLADLPLQLVNGDLIFFYTDGLVEVGHAGGPFFGIERALQVVQAKRDRPAAEIIEALYEAACQFGKPEKPHDDITTIVVKVLASGGSAGSA